jgi:hypothetical protein
MGMDKTAYVFEMIDKSNLSNQQTQIGDKFILKEIKT